MAPPTKYKPVVVDAILASVRNGATGTAAAEAAGVHRETLSVWLDRYPAFADAYARARAEAENAAVSVISAAAQAGDWRASAWRLERRRREDWGERRQSDPNETRAMVRDMFIADGMTPDEADQAVRTAEDWVRSHQRPRR